MNVDAASDRASDEGIDYGIDAPGVRRGMFVAAAAGVTLAGLALYRISITGGVVSVATGAAIVVGVLVALYGSGMGAYMTYGSRAGKWKRREALLDLAQTLRPWTGDEQVLDVGCGRGLMLIGAAMRLTTGTAVGVDVWRGEDQTENTPDAVLENARHVRVTDRVQIATGDARTLEFADASFDVVLSHWVVHNLPDDGDRAQALDEMLRVLRPGGVLVLADIQHLETYRTHLSMRGAQVAHVLDGGWEASVMGALSGGSYRPQALLAVRR